MKEHNIEQKGQAPASMSEVLRDRLRETISKMISIIESKVNERLKEKNHKLAKDPVFCAEATAVSVEKFFTEHSAELKRLIGSKAVFLTLFGYSTGELTAKHLPLTVEEQFQLYALIENKIAKLNKLSNIIESAQESAQLAYVIDSAVSHVEAQRKKEISDFLIEPENKPASAKPEAKPAEVKPIELIEQTKKVTDTVTDIVTDKAKGVKSIDDDDFQFLIRDVDELLKTFQEDGTPSPSPNIDIANPDEIPPIEIELDGLVGNSANTPSAAPNDKSLNEKNSGVPRNQVIKWFIVNRLYQKIRNAFIMCGLDPEKIKWYGIEQNTAMGYIAVILEIKKEDLKIILNVMNYEGELPVDKNSKLFKGDLTVTMNMLEELSLTLDEKIQKVHAIVTRPGKADSVKREDRSDHPKANGPNGRDKK